MPESLLVVGGGYIGLELGTVYAALGIAGDGGRDDCPACCPAPTATWSQPLARRLEQQFAAILLGHEGRRAMEETATAIRVTLRGRATGRTPRAGLRPRAGVRRPHGRTPTSLGLEKTQVEVDATGLRRRSTRSGAPPSPSIFAIGDVAGEPMLAHKATARGKVAVEAIAGGTSRRSSRAPSPPWCSPIRRSPGAA